MKIPTILLSVLVLVAASTLFAQPDDTLKIKPSYYELNDYVDDNEACFKCHGEIKFTLEDVDNDRSATKRMGP